MNLTSLMPQKPINTLKARNHDFLRSSYYGSIGRPDRSVKRRSAVELLQESKAFYVKSESVLDGRQELKNAEHLHVRSPRRVEVVSTLPRRGGHCLPLSCYAICPTCYPHATATNKDHLHLDFQLHTLQEHYLLHYERLQRESRDALRTSVQSSKNDRKLRRSSVPSPATTQLHSFQMERRAFDHSTTSPFATVEKLPSWAEGGSSLDFPFATNPPTSPKINRGNVTRTAERISSSPPPLPPKSPRATIKAIRPHDLQIQPIQPPPPLRRNSDHHVLDVHSKLRKLIRDRPSLKAKLPGQPPIHPIAIPVTLPSPILPAAPPTADVIMESPMSDGPIISPPAQFSTPVTPMIERQNSVVSVSSGKSRKSAVGMVGGSGNASISDMSMRHSSKTPSESTPSPCPMSPADGSTEDSSRICPPRPLQLPLFTKKLPSIPKSVTENALSRVASFESGIREHWDRTTSQDVRASQGQHSISSQTEEAPTGIVASPVRRPILRSKSDLSHRYKKNGNTHLFRNGGFTLVPVDFGTTAIFSQEHKFSSMDSRRQDSRRASAELEKFFDRMGLDSTDNSPSPPVGMPLKFSVNDHRSSEASPIFFSSMSSVDSIPRSVDSGDSPKYLLGLRTCAGYGYSSGDPSSSQNTSSSLVVQHGEPSIVERNARVIKWLFTCRKAVENSRIRR